MKIIHQNDFDISEEIMAIKKIIRLGIVIVTAIILLMLCIIIFSSNIFTQIGSNIILNALLGISILIIYKAYRSPDRHPDTVENYEASCLQYQASECGYEPIPHFSRLINFVADTDVTYDQFGARVNDEHTNTSNPVDVITLGCSQTWGQAVKNQDTFSAQLGQLTGLSIGNFAVSGFSSISSIIRLRKLLHLKPKIIIHGLWEDLFNRNIAESIPFPRQSPYYHVTPPVLLKNKKNDIKILFPKRPSLNLKHYRIWYLQKATGHDSSFINIYWKTYRFLVRVSSLLKKINAKILGGYRLLTKEERMEGMLYALDEMKKIADTVHARLIVAYIPNYLQDNMLGVPYELVTASQINGYSVICLQEIFVKMQEQGIPIAIPGDGHLTKEAHYRIAGEIAHLLGYTI